MFTLQDIGSLKQLAKVLIWPLSAAAFYSTFGLYFDEYLPAESSMLYKPAFIIFFTLQTIACAVAVEFIDFVIYMSDSLFSTYFQAIFGIVLLTVGLLPLNTIGNIVPNHIVSPLWAFFCLSWGLRIYLPEPSKSS